MAWKKLSTGIDMWDVPCLGSVKPKNGQRFMALCVDPTSKKPYRGLARQVIDREGTQDVAGYLDTSKLVKIESDDLLNWTVVGGLQMRSIDDEIEKLQTDKLRFLGLEDADIIRDEKGSLHVYFTIAYKIIGRIACAVYLGHATGRDLDSLVARTPLLGPLPEIDGFKELAASPENNGKHYHLTEIMIDKEDEDTSAIAAVRAEKWNSNWTFEHVALHPKQQKYDWCAGYASPCRILSREALKAPPNLNVLIFNGRETALIRNKQKIYRKFRPGLALYNPSTGTIPWVDSAPLFEDPAATTITFASDVIPYDKEHCLIYAHPNDSFVRAYKVSYDAIRARLPKKL